MALSRKENVYMAKLAERAQRHEEMIEFMEKVIAAAIAEGREEELLILEERTLLSVAYKKVIDAQRRSWRKMSSIEQKEESRGHEDHLAAIREFRGKIEDEISSTCRDMLRLLNDFLLPYASTAESNVFYFKTDGDYNRYLAEFQTGADRNRAVESSRDSYEIAQDIALTELAPSHPVRLGLDVNYSVFYWEILNSMDTAIRVAKRAFNDAVSEMDTIDEEYYNDTTLLLQILFENLKQWNPNEGSKGWLKINPEM